MKNKIKTFEEFRLIHNFMHPDDSLKGWINEDNFSSLYSEDWNVLIEVVEKIEALLPDDAVITIEYKDCYIPTVQFEDEIQGTGETKIEAVHNAVIQFIEWYNKQSK